jgi:hypothetical protein
VNFLCAVSRPQSYLSWKTLEEQLTKKHKWHASLDFAEQVYLPYWKAADCPWCLEHALLSKQAGSIALPPKWLRERIDALTDRRNGLSSGPLFLVAGAEDNGLGAQSPLAEAGTNSMSLVFILANALQALRFEPDPKKRLGFDAVSVRRLDQDSIESLGNVFGQSNMDRYSEGLIRGALLRVVRGSEWGGDNHARAIAKLVESAKDNSQLVMVGELLLSLARQGVSIQQIKERLVHCGAIGDMFA